MLRFYAPRLIIHFVLAALWVGLVNRPVAWGQPDPGEPSAAPEGDPDDGASSEPPSPEPTESEDEEGPSDDVPAEAETPDSDREPPAELDGEPTLRAPDVDALELSPETSALEPDSSEGELRGPADAMAELEQTGPLGRSADEDGWTVPQTSLTLHGYFRVRSELQDTFFLGRRGIGTDPRIDPPFSRFRPIESAIESADFPAGGCGDEGAADSSEACDSGTLGFANMRLRLEPTLSLGDDVRVHMMFDVFDNFVLGSTPAGQVAVPGEDGFERVADSPGAPLDTLSATAAPPETNRNSLNDAIRVRRAWAEVTNRGLGQLRFGRMGWHWGLGMLAHGGDGIDSDFQTDVDRIMAITKIAGLYWAAAYDFASEGFVQQNANDPLALPYDAGQNDDTDQFMFAVARRTDEEEQTEALQTGEWVLNAGAFLVYRNQLLTSQGVGDIFGDSPTPSELVRRGAEMFIPDVWFQFLYKSLRIEFEAAVVAGSIENIDSDPLEPFDVDDYGLLQFGGALEAEYRLLDDKLGLYFNTGLATGDEDVEGLTVEGGLPPQLEAGGVTDDRISTFRFHPNYRIDLILWRNIMRQVAGAYYFKPGISYDFIRNSFGQLLGLRADVIYSRAVAPIQTWGNDADLGIELNAAIYYRSEDGPDLLDGFYGTLQYGLLFPLAGLGYVEEEGRPDVVPGGNPDLENAQTVRLILGVSY